MTKTELKTDRIFEKLTVPYTKDEMEQLEQSILRQGCLEPIATWGGVILDGHKRYRICMIEEIDYEIKELYFTTVEDAVLWVCRQRVQYLSRKKMIFKYLVGKWYSTGIVVNRRREKRIRGRDDQALPDGKVKKQAYRTSKDIAQELGLNHTTVEGYKAVSTALDAISEKDPAMFDLIMQGKYKVYHEKLMEMSRWGHRKLQEERRRIQREEAVQKTSDYQSFSALYEAEKNRQYPGNGTPISVGIKEMPAFDPDMELRGLALTIPTWMNAMERACSKTDMNLVSELMKGQLADVLTQLKLQIGQMMEVL